MPFSNKSIQDFNIEVTFAEEAESEEYFLRAVKAVLKLAHKATKGSHRPDMSAWKSPSPF